MKTLPWTAKHIFDKRLVSRIHKKLNIKKVTQFYKQANTGHVHCQIFEIHRHMKQEAELTHDPTTLR